ncbi:MAG: porphobilinogen synthase [Methanomicrobiales archaeon]|nr:porphobilinogen synthase [Methanomicrobiales archaeon]
MFPERRLRRLRRRGIRELLSEVHLSKTDLVYPIFIDENIRERVPIATMPGQYRYPVDEVSAVAERISATGVGALLLFGIPACKDAVASSAFSPDGVIQQAIPRIKEAVPEMVVITDVCGCEYTDHGHCGIIGDTPHGRDLLNDPSLELMGKIAVSHANQGADIVAPSCMLDGMVAVIRRSLDRAGHQETLIMSYSTKFASSFYGPFRSAAHSSAVFGDRTTYQLNPANAREAFRESEIDMAEGADILMVKPAGMFLDILAEVVSLGLPVAAYQVSGEYAMIRAAAAQGWIDEKSAIMESLICMKRAGADLIITYFAEEVAGWL